MAKKKHTSAENSTRAPVLPNSTPAERDVPSQMNGSHSGGISNGTAKKVPREQSGQPRKIAVERGAMLREPFVLPLPTTSNSSITTQATQCTKLDSVGVDAWTQTTEEDLNGDEDLLVKFVALTEWRKMETILELIALLNPVQLKLMESCIRGQLAPQMASVETFEKRVNGNVRNLEANAETQSTAKLREMFLPTLSLLSPCNYQGAHQLVQQLQRFLGECPPVVRGRNEEEVGMEYEGLLALAVASLHHPATLVADRLQVQGIVEHCKKMLVTLHPMRQRLSAEDSPPTIKLLTCLEYNESSAEAVLEMTWTDGIVSYASRSLGQLQQMQSNLLEAHGLERTSDRRVLPYFPRHATDETIKDYITQLANLPARILLDAIFTREFHHTRQLSSQLSWPPSRIPNPQSVHVDSPWRKELVFGHLPHVELPPLALPLHVESCPYCTGAHTFEECPVYSTGSRSMDGKGADWDRIRCNCCRGTH